MLLFFVLILAVGLVVLVAGQLLIRFGQSDARRVEMMLAGESIAEHYRPLERLLRASDSDYLSRQPGITPARIRQFRAQRRDLFRQYLSNLTADFGALCFLTKALMVQSPVSRPDLSNALSRTRRSFYWTVVKIQLVLASQAVGLPSVSVDGSELLNAFNELCAQARTLQISAEPSLA